MKCRQNLNLRKLLQTLSPRDPLDHLNVEDLPPVSAPPSSNVSSDGNLMIDEYRPPLPPRRSRTTLRNGYDYDPDSIYDSPGFMELEDRDKKGAEWVRRVSTAITALKNTNTQIHIFMDSDDQFFESSCNKLDEDVRVK